MLVAPSSVPLANMGFWPGIEPAGPDSLERANFALFDLVIDAAGPSAGDVVVDVGSGFGVNAVRVAQRVRGCSVVGLNLSRVQLETSKRIAADAGLDGRVRFVRADAGRLPLADASASCILSVEAAFHFTDRDSFFSEVRRVLAPGGRLSMVDLVPLPPRGRLDRLAWRFTRGLAIPEQNIMSVDAYRAQVARAGLDVTMCRSIVDKVYPTFRRWQLTRPLRDLARIPPLMAVSTAGFLFYPWEYVQITATVPSADSRKRSD